MALPEVLARFAATYAQRSDRPALRGSQRDLEAVLAVLRGKLEFKSGYDQSPPNGTSRATC